MCATFQSDPVARRKALERQSAGMAVQLVGAERVGKQFVQNGLRPLTRMGGAPMDSQVRPRRPEGREKVQPQHMVVVIVAQKQVHILRSLTAYCIPQPHDPGSGVQNRDVSVDPDADTGGVASGALMIGVVDGDGAAGTPDLDFEFRHDRPHRAGRARRPSAIRSMVSPHHVTEVCANGGGLSNIAASKCIF